MRKRALPGGPIHPELAAWGAVARAAIDGRELKTTVMPPAATADWMNCLRLKTK